MEAVIKIIEENIPEVNLTLLIAVVSMTVHIVAALDEVNGQTECANTCMSFQLTGLNLSNNRIQKLDELTNLVTKVPNLKTLNLSHNEVRVAAQLIERLITSSMIWFNLKSSSPTNLFCFFSSS